MKTIIRNGHVCSYDTKANKTEYEAVAFEDGVITAAGTAEDVMKQADPDTKVIDAGGASVLSGFCDSHLHVMSVVEMICSVNIYMIEPEEGEDRDAYTGRVMEKIVKYAKDNPDAPVIRGTGWNPAAYSTLYGSLPTAAELDKFVSDRPVLLRSYCHHFLWLNTKALEMTGITKDTELGQGCIVEKDEGGNPTGVFVDVPATEMVLDSFVLADYSIEEYKQGILFFQNEFGLKNGIVAVFDAMLRPHAREAYRQLAEEGLLKMRVRSVFLADPTKPDTQFDAFIAEKGKYDCGDMFRIDAVKFFFDGGEITSLMKTPLEPEFLKRAGYPEDYLGEYVWEPERANQAFAKLAKAGFQIHIHVMGDGASCEALDAFAYAKEHAEGDLRHTLTHIRVIEEKDIERMAALGVVASMQAQWGTKDFFSENYSVPVFGRRRTDCAYPVGELWRRGVVISAATDFPIDPMYCTMGNIQIGMTRSVPKGHPDYAQYKGQVLGPEEDVNKYCASLDQMLAAYTAGGAYQLFMEQYTGSIEVGKSADFVILDKDIEAVDVNDIENIQFKSVIFKGETVYGQDK